MHQKITCRAQVLTPASAGEQQKSWQDIAIVWAEISARSGDLVTSARQNYMAVTYKVRVRYQDRLLITRNILWQGQAYRVSRLLNPDNRKRILELEMVEDHP
jgi:SPP1 family predicted phage head-tail adaptor